MKMYIYLAIVALLLVLIVVNLFKKEKDIKFQIDAALVIIPLLLRLLRLQ